MTHNITEENLETHIMRGFILSVSMFGLVGNGMVFWFLCFRLKRGSFTFITNLAVADFGVLFAMFIHYSLSSIVSLYGHSNDAIGVLNLCLSAFCLVMFCASTLFLAAISTDRCIAVVFPLWHRSHRPKFLPAIVSVALWLLACVLGGLIFYYGTLLKSYTVEITVFFLFDLFMVLVILTLCIRLYGYSYLCRQRKLLQVILFSLSVFIVTLFPQCFFLIFIKNIKRADAYMDLLASLNSSANPVIYVFMGRLNSVPSRRSLKVVLGRVFKEEESYEGQTSNSKGSVGTTC